MDTDNHSEPSQSLITYSEAFGDATTWKEKIINFMRNFDESLSKKLIAWCDEQSKYGPVKLQWAKESDLPFECKLLSDGVYDEVIDEIFYFLTYDITVGNSLTVDEWEVRGEAEYDPKRKTFIGSFGECEDDDESSSDLDCNIEIRLPSTLNFTKVSITIYANAVEVDSAIKFSVKKGGDKGDFKGAKQNLLASLNQQIHELLTEKFIGNEKEYTNRGFAQNDYKFHRNDFIQEGEELVAYISELRVSSQFFLNKNENIDFHIFDVNKKDEDFWWNALYGYTKNKRKYEHVTLTKLPITLSEVFVNYKQYDSLSLLEKQNIFKQNYNEQLSYRLIEWCDEQSANGILRLKWESDESFGVSHDWWLGDTYIRSNDWALYEIFQCLLMEITFGNAQLNKEWVVRGDAEYDPERKSFIGSYVEECWPVTTIDCQVQVHLPNWLKFKEVSINLWAKSDDCVSFDGWAGSRFIGPFPNDINYNYKDVDKAQNELDKSLMSQLQKVYKEKSNDYDHLSSFSIKEKIQFEDFLEEGNQLVASIDQVKVIRKIHHSKNENIDFHLFDVVKKKEDFWWNTLYMG